MNKEEKSRDIFQKAPDVPLDSDLYHMISALLDQVLHPLVSDKDNGLGWLPIKYRTYGNKSGGTELVIRQAADECIFIYDKDGRFLGFTSIRYKEDIQS